MNAKTMPVPGTPLPLGLPSFLYSGPDGRDVVDRCRDHQRPSADAMASVGGARQVPMVACAAGTRVSSLENHPCWGISTMPSKRVNDDDDGVFHRILRDGA